jgi:hypothetical protein
LKFETDEDATKYLARVWLNAVGKEW